MTIKLVNFKDIRIDGGTQFREEINQNLVKEYKEDMMKGDVFPPIDCTFDGSNYWLARGFHRYFAMQSMGLRQVEINYKPGTQEDAQDWALGDNAHHGLRRTPKTKRNQVESALSKERHKNKSDREIAKLCNVSHTFVASVRSSKVKERQAENQKKHKESGNNSTQQAGNNSTFEGGNNSTPSQDFDPKPPMTQDFAPSDEELEANQLKMQANMDLAIKIIEADDILATLHAEIKRLSDDNASLQSRVNALMREKNKAIDLLQKAQRELDKIKKAKK
jgi:hypothetical protein